MASSLNGDTCSSTMSSSSSGSVSDLFQTPTEALSSVSLGSDKDQPSELGNGTPGPLGMPPKSDKRRTFRATTVEMDTTCEDKLKDCQR
ncbi:hypothetical protein Ocin01_06510 [Orchesella cincta]|uniref:Uncharacterized protein n=1 Tax=Orchesella cincta TaxID=48709 RepID=A0A1D2N4I6_ORCCI|nr:hypothetical protein Ocin01_06510 [Orchesella cincta]